MLGRSSRPPAEFAKNFRRPAFLLSPVAKSYSLLVNVSDVGSQDPQKDNPAMGSNSHAPGQKTTLPLGECLKKHFKSPARVAMIFHH
jgi:hypothetical protein